MPGPRLSPRISNPQPIAPVSGGNALGDVAQIVSVGLQGFEIYKEREEKLEDIAEERKKNEVLMLARAEIHKVNLSLEQGRDGVTVKNVGNKIQSILLRYAGENQSIQGDVFKLGKQMGNGSTFNMAKDDFTYSRSKADKVSNERASTAKGLNIVTTGKTNSDVDTEIDLITARIGAVESKELSLRGRAVEGDLNVDAAEGILVDRVREEGSAFGRSIVSNYSFTPTQINQMTPEDKASLTAGIEGEYSRIEEALLNNEAYTLLTGDAIKEKLKGLRATRDLAIRTLSDPNLQLQLKAHLTLVDTQANMELKGKVSDAVTLKTVDILSRIKDDSLIAEVIKDVDLVGTAFKGLLNGVLKTAISTEEATDEEPAWMLAPDRIRNEYAQKIILQFQANLKGAKDTTSSVEDIKIMTGLIHSMTNNKKSYGGGVWSAVLPIAAGKDGKVIATEPSLLTLKQSIRKQLPLMENSLHIRGRQVVTEDDKLTISGDSIVFDKDPVYASRVNMYVSANANIRDITLEEAIDAFQESASDLFNSIKSEPTSFDEEYARELVKMGLADDMAAALSIIRSL